MLSRCHWHKPETSKGSCDNLYGTLRTSTLQAPYVFQQSQHSVVIRKVGLSALK